jgi:hypothetical protein
MSVVPCTHLRHLQSRLYNSSCALATSGGAGGDGQIQPPNVRDLARMANIGVTDEEVSTLLLMMLTVHTACTWARLPFVEPTNGRRDSALDSSLYCVAGQRVGPQD